MPVTLAENEGSGMKLTRRLPERSYHYDAERRDCQTCRPTSEPQLPMNEDRLDGISKLPRMTSSQSY